VNATGNARVAAADRRPTIDDGAAELTERPRTDTLGFKRPDDRLARPPRLRPEQ